MTILIEKRAALQALKAEIAEKQREIRNYSHEVSESDYDSMLDDCHDEVNICGSLYSPSYALKNLDRVAYDTGKSDYESSFDLDEVPEYVTLTEELEELENAETDLEEEIEVLEEEESAE